MYRLDTTQDKLNFTIINNDAPQYAGDLPDINATELTTGTYKLNNFTDAEGDAITYSVSFQNGSGLDSSWISFNSTTMNITYTPPDNVTFYQLKVTAQDDYNTPTQKYIDLNVDLKPRVNSSINPVSGVFIANEQSSFLISAALFSDEDEVDDMSYTLQTVNGSAVPSWLHLASPNHSGGSFTLSGLAPTYQHQVHNLLIIATDSKNLKNNASLTITVQGKECLYMIEYSELTQYM